MSLLDIWLGILQGLGTTAAVTAYGLVFAVPFALVFGVAQYLTHGGARLLVTSVIEFWRSSPVIILLFVFYEVCGSLDLNLCWNLIIIKAIETRLEESLFSNIV